MEEIEKGIYGADSYIEDWNVKYASVFWSVFYRSAEARYLPPALI